MRTRPKITKKQFELNYLLRLFILRERERERASSMSRGGAEREERENPKQALHCEREAHHGAPSQEL